MVMNPKIFLLHMIPSVVLPLIVQLFAHEFGHMLAGGLTGWRMIYLQLFRIAFVKENSGLKIRTVPSICYRCIMYPKSLYLNASLYTLGGIMTNLLLTAVAFLGMLKYFCRPVICMYAMGLFSFGVMLLITNGIPNIGRVCNDMACMLIMKNNQASKKAHNCQMVIAHQLFEGKTYGQMDRRILEVGDGRINTDILAYHAVLEYYFHLDNDEYTLARDALGRIEMDTSISKEVRNIVSMERLYLNLVLSILRKGFSASVGKMKQEEIEKAVIENEIKGDIHSVRVKAVGMAYRYYIEGKLEAAIKFLDQSIKEMDDMRCLYLGEKLFCMDQLTGLRNMLQRDYIAMSKSEAVEI
jgi:hypothetical protein